MLGRAIGNVVRNAVSAVAATGKPGSVTLTTGEHPPTLTVDDTGVGIDPLEIPLVFLPFRSGRPGGFGLGLALAKKIILLHEGSISIEALPEGGTRVLMSFPPLPEMEGEEKTVKV